MLLGVASPCAWGQGGKGIVDTVATPPNGQDVQANEYYFAAINARMHDDDAKAMDNFQKFVAMKPNVAAAYNELASLYINQKDIDKAEESIKKAIALDKTNKWYKEAYANILAIRNKYAEAGKIMGELADEYPSDHTFLKTAVDYLEQGTKYTEALKFINKALETNANDEELLAHKAQLLMRLDQPDEAMAVMKLLIEKDNQNGSYYKILGELYDKSKQPEKATELYNVALKLIPNDPALLLGVANHYLKSGDTVLYRNFLRATIVNPDLDVETQMELLDAYIQTLKDDSEILAKGISLIAEIVKQHPGDPAALATYGDFLYRNNQKESAVIAYKHSLAIAPSNFNLWIRFLGVLTDREDADSLIHYSEKALRYFPNQSLAHYYNGIGHYNKRDYPKAINALNRAIDLMPENNNQRLAGMYGFMGEIYNTTKDYANSDQAYEKALQFDPEDASVLNNYSYFLSERNEKLDAAEKMSERSLKLKPDEPTYMDTYGWIEYKKGNFSKARTYIENAIKMAGKNAEAALYDHLGNVCYKLDDKDKALECWKLAKSLGSDDPQIDKKISEVKLYE